MHPSRFLPLVVWLVALPVHLQAAPSPDDDRSALADQLNAVESMAPEDAAREASSLAAALGKKPASELGGALLLLGAAQERAGDLSAAHQTYLRLGGDDQTGPHSASAAFRLSVLAQPDLSVKARDSLYAGIATQPDAEGWFLNDGQWTWSSTRRAAWQSLAGARSDRLSYRLFTFLRSKSTFSTPYAYLFVLLALAVGAKLLQLPLLIRAAAVLAVTREHGDEIAGIHAAYANDPTKLNERLIAFYKGHGVSFAVGCLLLPVDLIFTIWALVTINAFRPQMLLDGARFLWASDVTQFNLGVVVCSTLAGLMASALNPAALPNQRAQQISAQVVWGVIVATAAWYWKWPAFVFIFWAILSLLGLLFHLVLVPIQVRLLDAR